MVRILKTANVSMVLAFMGDVRDIPPSLRRDIWVQTKLGFRYKTITWQPIPGTAYENTNDPLSLVRQILEKERGLDSDKDFMLMIQYTP